MKDQPKWVFRNPGSWTWHKVADYRPAGTRDSPCGVNAKPGHHLHKWTGRCPDEGGLVCGRCFR